jgi:predicted transcriptional regulator
MGREVSKDTEKAYLKGEILTVEELKKRFSLAITINNADIVKILLETDYPLTAKEIGEKLGVKKSEPVYRRMRRLFKDKLVVRFHLGGNRYGYLLSEKGWRNYQKAKTIGEIE